MIEIDGRKILLNGVPTTLFGFRVGSAPLRDDWTEQLIEQFPLWEEHGINSLTVWIQGTSGGFVRALEPDGPVGEESVLVRANYGREETYAPYGRTTGARVLTRTRRIAEEARKHKMVVIVGVVYIHSVRDDDSPESLAGIVARASAAVADLDNVIINIWNEPRADRSNQGPEEIQNYLAAAHEAAPERPIGTGYIRGEQNSAIAALSDLDLLLMDAGDITGTIDAVEDLKRFGKPVINVESFAGNGNGYVDVDLAGEPQSHCCVDYQGWRRLFGVWKDEDYIDGSGKNCAGRQSYLSFVDHVGRDESRQSHLMLHVAGWFQGASRVERPEQIGSWKERDRWNCVFHRGEGRADGTPSDPGIGWLLEAVAAVAR